MFGVAPKVHSWTLGACPSKHKDGGRDRVQAISPAVLVSRKARVLHGRPSEVWLGIREQPRSRLVPTHAGLQTARSFSRLCAVEINAHSWLTRWTPRRRNCRKPRACLICPFTGSTTSLRLA